MIMRIVFMPLHCCTIGQPVTHGQETRSRYARRGRGSVDRSMSMKAFLEKLSRDEMTTYGLVLESDLRQVVTLSVGQITINDVMISYHGVQKSRLGLLIEALERIRRSKIGCGRYRRRSRCDLCRGETRHVFLTTEKIRVKRQESNIRGK